MNNLLNAIKHCIRFFMCNNSFVPLAHLGNKEKQHEEVIWPAEDHIVSRWQRWSSDVIMTVDSKSYACTQLLHFSYRR